MSDGSRGGGRLRVWCPNARGSVELELGSEFLPMRRADGGWWESDLRVPAATRYRFRLDGGGSFPDPRSPWQPDGVHGPSATWDHKAYRWSDAGWCAPPLSEAVLYELHVGTFTPEGTYRAATGKLGHLRELGVTHIELMPLAAFPGEHGWGYDGVAPFAPHAAYGEPDELKAFVDAAHGAGLAVLLDVVYNHLGPDGNYLGQFGPYFTSRRHTPWGEAVNFDGPDSDEVRAYFVDNALMWMRDYRFDGLRLDAVHAIYDSSATHILETLAERTRELSAVEGRRLVLVAESDLNDPRIVRPTARGGYGLDAHWIDDFHHAVHAFFTGERNGYYADFGSLAALAKAVRQGYVFDGAYSAFRRRTFGRPPLDVRPEQLVAFAQNHDQTGNRAGGERLSHLISGEQLMAVAAIVILSRYTPMLFQGEEWGATAPFLYFTDHQDPQLAKAVSRGRLNEFKNFDWGRGKIPDPQSRSTFEKSKLDWSEVAAPGASRLLDWHAALISLRKRFPLASGDAVRVEFDERTGYFAFWRSGLAVECNLSAGALRRVCTGEIALSSQPDSGDVLLPGSTVVSLGG